MRLTVLVVGAALFLHCGGALAAARAPRVTEPGLVGRGDIILFSDFESENWWRDWGERRLPRNCDLIGGEEAFGGAGRSLRVTVKAGSHYGTSVSFRTKGMLGSEPEEMYLRYYVKFDPDWQHATSGGKMPGFGGTYGRAGWGGRPVNGSDGWSARGGFSRPRGDSTCDGFYCYHADMKGRFGSSWRFKPALKHGTWYCVEKYCKLNTPAEGGQTKGKNDGVLRGWINGRVAFEKTDIRFRDVETLKMETIWFNIYHGGATPVPPQDIHVYFDNVVIARNYVGPAVYARPGRKETGPSIWAIAAKKAREARKRSPTKTAPDPLAPYLEQIRAARERASKGEAEEAAKELASIEGAPDDLKAIARGLTLANELRSWIVEGASAGRSETVWVDFFGRPARGKLVSADDDGLVASVMGAELTIAWTDLSPKKLHAIALRYADEDGLVLDEKAEALTLYAHAYGLDEN